MIEKLMSLNHFTYKKPFSGSDKGNRFKYIIQMKIKEIPVEEEEVSEGEEQKIEKVKVLTAVCWSGDGNSKVTPDEEKQFKEFEFSEEGYEQLLIWLNNESDKIV